MKSATQQTMIVVIPLATQLFNLHIQRTYK